MYACSSIFQPLAEGTARAFRVIDANTDMLVVKLMLEKVCSGPHMPALALHLGTSKTNNHDNISLR